MLAGSQPERPVPSMPPPKRGPCLQHTRSRSAETRARRCLRRLIRGLAGRAFADCSRGRLQIWRRRSMGILCSGCCHDLRRGSSSRRGRSLYRRYGATISRPIIRRRNQVWIVHTPICTQLDWCRAHGVRRAVFTHCGSQIVGGDERVLGTLVRRLGRERGVEARIAYDGKKVTFDKPRTIGSKTTLE